MMRWLMLVVSIAAFTTAFRATTPGTLGWALLLGFIAILGAFIGFAAARVKSVARGQHNREQTLLVTSRGKIAPGRPAAPPGPPGAPTPGGGDAP